MSSPRSWLAQRTHRRRFLVPVMSVVDRFIYIDLVIMWLCAEEFFWSWWLRSSHVVTAAGMVVNSMLSSGASSCQACS